MAYVSGMEDEKKTELKNGQNSPYKLSKSHIFYPEQFNQKCSHSMPNVIITQAVILAVIFQKITAVFQLTGGSNQVST